MSLVKQLVALHQGSVRAESAGEGDGAFFEVRLPQAVASEGEAPPEGEVSTDALTPGAGKHVLDILLAEDQDDAAEAMVMLMKRWGHAVVRAATGREALRKASEQNVDVAILDIGLPDMDGWQVARALRDGVASRSLRIAALSGLGQADDLDRSVAAGIDEHFIKPVDPPLLKVWLEGG